MTRNFRKFTFHFGKPRNRGVLSFHKAEVDPWAFEVHMYGLGHSDFGFIGILTFKKIK